MYIQIICIFALLFSITHQNTFKIMHKGKKKSSLLSKVIKAVVTVAMAAFGAHLTNTDKVIFDAVSDVVIEVLQ